MSRTTHTTPAFPRALRGPRGGRHIAPTPCAECVSFTSCRPGTCSAPYGCESWVDEDGRRVDLDAARIDYGEPIRPCRMDADEPCADCRNCETTTPDPAGAALDTPDPEDPNPYAPSPATLSEMSGIFPTTDDPGPLFSGRKSN